MQGVTQRRSRVRFEDNGATQLLGYREVSLGSIVINQCTSAEISKLALLCPVCWSQVRHKCAKYDLQFYQARAF
jgi:hypothetical protein